MNVVIRPNAQQALTEIARSKGLETGRDRLAAMKPQCGFGELGTCCRTCYMGPCRIDPFGDGPKTGICGISPDAMVARNLLRETVGGAASHVGHARHLLLTLRDALNGDAPYEIRGADKAFALGALFGVPVEGRTAHEVCRDLVEIALQDFGRQDGKLNNWMSKRAPAKELAMWETLGIAYSNPHNEIETAMHASSMGNDADPVSLLLRTLKVSLVDGWTGLALCTDIQDILFGTPQVTVVEASVGVLEEHAVNIATHGHNPVLSEKILEWAGKLEPEARAAGAESINVVGVCCTGNELSMRHGVPLAAHNAQSELILATGAVDAMVVDIQCIWPSLPQLAACFGTAFITTDEMVHIPGAQHIEFEPVHADESAQKIVRVAIEAFGKRRGKQVDIPKITQTAVAGLSLEAIVGILSKVNADDPLKPVIDNVANGNILGFAGVVGCSSVKFRDNAMTERMVKELLASNVLVVTTGCTAHLCAQDGLLTSQATEQYCGEGLKAVLTALGQAAGLGGPLPPVWHMGSCVDNSRIVDLLAAVAARLGVRISDLPAIGSAPELVQEKAISIGVSFLALGTSVHVAPAPRVLGGPVVTQVLTQDLQSITGAKVYVEYDPIKAAAGMIAHIKEKRAALGLS
jgi:anaerobic carbon-monoxide dehydrogenase catalytic subunit